MSKESADDIRFMKSALKEARKGLGQTSPNPVVGAVLVKNGAIIGRGFHHRAGSPHAEVNAIANAAARGRGVVGATLYVTLEPCCHHGKTPPCTCWIIENSISRVVISCCDPNPLVDGGGIASLREAGISVTTGVLEAEGSSLNVAFFKSLTKKEPWIILKGALSLDGKIAPNSGDSKWITGDRSRKQVQMIRNSVDAIMVGRGTVLKDDPSLTLRPFRERSKPYLRVIISSSLSFSRDLKVFSDMVRFETRIYSSRSSITKLSRSLRDFYDERGVQLVGVSCHKDGRLNLAEIVAHLYSTNHHRVLLEGGGRLNGSFFDQGLIDEVHLFMAPILMGGGMSVGHGVNFIGGEGSASLEKAERLTQIKMRRLHPDFWVHGLVKK